MGQFANFEKYEDQNANSEKIKRRILKFLASRYNLKFSKFNLDKIFLVKKKNLGQNIF